MSLAAGLTRLKKLGPALLVALVAVLWVAPRLSEAELSKEPADGAAKVLGLRPDIDPRTDPKAKDQARAIAS